MHSSLIPVLVVDFVTQSSQERSPYKGHCFLHVLDEVAEGSSYPAAQWQSHIFECKLA